MHREKCFVWQTGHKHDKINANRQQKSAENGGIMSIIGEFLVKLGVVGEKDIENAAERSARGMHKAGESAEKAGDKFRRASHGFDSFIESASHGMNVFGGVTDILGSTRDFVSDLIGPAVGFEALNSRLEAVTGSADAAGRKLKFAQDVANPSNFTFNELADATVALEAFGINAERNLPTMARLGMAFGSTGEDLQTLVRGLGDLSTGKFFEADLASKFGLNRDMFKAKGIKFDQSGEMLSSANEAFAALEGIVNQKYGSIFDKMSGTYSAKLATLQDITEKFKRTVGEGILSVIGPGLDKLASVSNAVIASGVLTDTVTAAVGGLARLFGSGPGQDTMVSFMSGLLSVLSQLPDAIGKTGGAINAVISSVFENAKMAFDYINQLSEASRADFASNLTALGAVMAALTDPTTPLWERPKNASSAIEAARSARSAYAPWPTESPNFKALDLSPYKFDLLKNQSDFQQRMETAMKSPSSGVPDPRGDFLSRPSSRVEDALDEIKEQTRATAHHTGKMADPLSMRREIIGGAGEAQLGATPAELFGGGVGGGFGRSWNPRMEIEIKGEGMFAKFMREYARITLSESQGVQLVQRF
jgi:hypothetical protein